MDLNPRIQQTYNGRVVEVGARWNQPLSWPHLQVVTTCENIDPGTYRAEVRMGAHVLITTDPTDDIHEAERAAENAFATRFADLFSA